MSAFLVFLAIAVAGAAAVAASGRWGRKKSGGAEDAGGGWEVGHVAALQGLSEHEARLPAVLLPEHPRAEDLDSLRFSTALRGYRMDQVDEVLEVLRAELGAKERLIRQMSQSQHDGGSRHDGGAHPAREG
ncbi:DivIVA domain-containing protein [Arthrobacter sp. CAU 1506]|uniref:DivIVA domain-containing protein n=1 Tax=Arthrobacter sp. CAU 1506 TaxID=2560052 RepID=UPI0010AC19BD|nr:DivIVA domain-containing protein [Arthrobacter sp. CAU 1506]TJY71338.1 DivIVA domain-containing protein [Arthrobacter sp. CAU 1506]